MNANADARIAREFHDRTAHTPASVRQSGHTLDWDNKPLPFKIYADLEPIPLPREVSPLGIDTLRALHADDRSGAVTLEMLATLLYYTAGVTRKLTYPSGIEVLFRAAASTGALYQTEVYVAAGHVEDLGPGLYHFCPGDFALRRLRDADVRDALARAAGDDSLARRAVTIVLSAIFWRNTWKYQARGYRHLFWDSGTMLANLDAAGRALGLAPRIVTGFVDADANRVLGVDVEHEAALELIALGPETVPAPSVTLEPVDHRTVPLSGSEVDYPLLREIHAASSLASAAAVHAWRGAPPPRRPAAGTRRPLTTAREESGRSLGETIERRGSTREFSHAPLDEVELATVLAAATRAVDADVPPGLIDIYVVINAVNGVEPGAWAYDRDAHALILVRPGDFRRRSAYLCLEQALGGDAAAVLYFLAPLDDVLAAHGNRGYRLVNLEAGLAGGRAYLAAYALGFGASGLTFYDHEVVDMFSPHAAGKDAVFVTALGRSRRRRAA
jgi:SagB-type dehydrogenase family enzyme